MRVQRPGNQKIRNGDPIRSFLPFSGQTGESWASDAAPNIDIQDNSKHNIEDGSKDLEDPSGAHRVCGMFHFRNENKEHEVSRVCKDRICNADEGRCKIRAEDEGILRYWKIDARTDHTNEARHDDANYRKDGEPSKAVEGARKGTEECGDRKYASVEHEAEFVFAESGEGDLAGEDLAAR